MDEEPTQQSTQDKDSLPEGSFIAEEQTALAVLVGSSGMDCRWVLPASAGGTQSGRVWKLGRSPNADFQLDPSKKRLSNIHFRIWATPDDPPTLMIADCSTNGTFLNNVRMTKDRNYMLVNGDVISVGVGVPQDEIKIIVSIPKNERPAPTTGVNADYDFGETIGQGAFALVRIAIHRQTGTKRAVKIIQKSKITGGVAVKREIEILRAVQNPYIVCLQDFYEDDSYYYLIMDYVPGGDLMDFVQDNGPIPEDACREIIRQVLQAIYHVHRMGISHRDLKPDNILIAQEDPVVVKVADFGLAKISSQGTFLKTFCGTLSYLAPEVLAARNNPRQGGYSSLVDIWSVGCLAYVILTGYMPFGGSTQEELWRSVQAGSYNMEPLKAVQLSPEGYDFLSKLLTVDPKLRPTAHNALKHPWVSTGNEPFNSLPDASGTGASGRSNEHIRNDDLKGISCLNIQSSQPQPEPQPEPQPALPAEPLPGQLPDQLEQDEDGSVPSLGHDHPSDSESDSHETRHHANFVASQSAKHPSVGIRDLDYASMGELGDEPAGSWLKLQTRANSIPFKDVYVSGDALTMGRTPNPLNDIVVPDPRMSQVHCRVVRRLVGSRWTAWFQDFSTNVCYVNGVALRRNMQTQVFNDDVITVFLDGDSMLQFQVVFVAQDRYDVHRVVRVVPEAVPPGDVPVLAPPAAPRSQAPKRPHRSLSATAVQRRKIA